MLLWSCQKNLNMDGEILKTYFPCGSMRPCTIFVLESGNFPVDGVRAVDHDDGGGDDHDGRVDDHVVPVVVRRVVPKLGRLKC